MARRPDALSPDRPASPASTMLRAEGDARQVETWVSGHPALARIDGRLVVVPEPVLARVYAEVFRLGDGALKTARIDWAALERRLGDAVLDMLAAEQDPSACG